MFLAGVLFIDSFTPWSFTLWSNVTTCYMLNS